jgi:hypothetical protein
VRDLTRATELKYETTSSDETTPPRETKLLPHEYEQEASELTSSQDGLRKRTLAVIGRLKELQASEKKNFGKPIAQLGNALNAMIDATSLLRTPDTGSPTIAAETEAIEWLLLTKKAGKSGGGGGGATPGGGTSGGTTDTVASALSGIGEGIEAKPRFVQQATGNVESNHPEEFKTGLDAYFGTLEKGQ